MSVNINSSPQSQLVINKMTNDTYNKLKNGQISGQSLNENELYFITDDKGVEITDIMPSSAVGSQTQPIYWDGDSFEPIANINPSISITAGTASAAPQVNVTVLGQSGTAQSITTASTSVYGVTKLNSAIDSTSTTEAATPSAVKSAYDLANNHKYWANIESAVAASYKTIPEVAKLIVNGKTASEDTDEASTKNVELQYNASSEVLNFVFH